jgi:NAD(P)-dependent dehydrogenase (short-subunit alcohol dehydrogenase family)
MSRHPAIAAGKVAVITGGADGIGLAAARFFHSVGMQVCIADVAQEKLAAVEIELKGVQISCTDVSSIDEVRALKERVYSAHGQVDVLMNNAGTGRPNSSWEDYDNWQLTLGVNLGGVINGAHVFVPAMLEQSSPGLIINTGSKQGITTPPGNPAYNVSKAGIKAATEALAYDLRSTPGCQLSAHLLVPGFTYTGMIRRFLPEQPAGAWSPEQVVTYMVEAIGRGDFYILCPDNDTPRDVDNKRMAWAMGDLIENRPALSRWHPDYEKAFEDFVK